MFERAREIDPANPRIDEVERQGETGSATMLLKQSQGPSAPTAFGSTAGSFLRPSPTSPRQAEEEGSHSPQTVKSFLPASSAPPQGEGASPQTPLEEVPEERVPSSATDFGHAHSDSAARWFSSPSLAAPRSEAPSVPSEKDAPTELANWFTPRASTESPAPAGFRSESLPSLFGLRVEDPIAGAEETHSVSQENAPSGATPGNLEFVPGLTAPEPGGDSRSAAAESELPASLSLPPLDPNIALSTGAFLASPQSPETPVPDLAGPPEPGPSAWDTGDAAGTTLAPSSDAAGMLEFVAADQDGDRTGAGKRKQVETLIKRARDLMNLDDQTGAMELVAAAIALAPDDPEVLALRDRNAAALLSVYEAKLGPQSQCPRILLKEDEIIWLNLDHRAGYVLSQIDGRIAFGDLFDISPMSRLDTARILSQLIDEGVIGRS